MIKRESLKAEKFAKALGKKRMELVEFIEIDFGADIVVEVGAKYPFENDTTVRINCVEDGDTFAGLVEDFKFWVDGLVPTPDSRNWGG